jgi:hypothetical protein
MKRRKSRADSVPEKKQKKAIGAESSGSAKASPQQLRLDVSEFMNPTNNKSEALETPTRAPELWIRLSPAKPSAIYETYWRFAFERQEIFFRRLSGKPSPWTQDRILERHKFTNVYRASDRVSQFLIRDVIYSGTHEPKDVLFRILLFKFFNKIETWQLLQTTLGEVTLKDYTFERYDAVLTNAMSHGVRIYSAAYIMPSGVHSIDAERTKHRFHLRLIERIIADEVDKRLAGVLSMREAFELLRSYPSIGNFLAYQFVTDINYSTITAFSESEFVQPGPGALDGIRKCFSSLGGLSESDIIRSTMDQQEREFERLGLDFQTLWGRRLQLIDCQNLFCEVGKYARVQHPGVRGTSDRTRIKQRFVPNQYQPAVWYPPKWGINAEIANGATVPTSHVPTARKE